MSWLVRERIHSIAKYFLNVSSEPGSLLDIGLAISTMSNTSIKLVQREDGQPEGAECVPTEVSLWSKRRHGKSGLVSGTWGCRTLDLTFDNETAMEGNSSQWTRALVSRKRTSLASYHHVQGGSCIQKETSYENQNAVSQLNRWQDSQSAEPQPPSLRSGSDLLPWAELTTMQLGSLGLFTLRPPPSSQQTLFLDLPILISSILELLWPIRSAGCSTLLPWGCVWGIPSPTWTRQFASQH